MEVTKQDCENILAPEFRSSITRTPNIACVQNNNNNNKFTHHIVINSPTTLYCHSNSIMDKYNYIDMSGIYVFC